MGIGAESGENPADVGALEGICNLNSEEAEAQVEHLPETQFAFSVHNYFLSRGLA